VTDRDSVPTVDERGGDVREEPAPSPAAVDGDRYRRGAEIARGGMGRVVEAEDVALGRTVALKETLAVDGETRERFDREVRITARLEHPSIVPLYDAGVGPDGAPFYVMRRVSGQPLDEKIAAAPDLDARLTLLPNLLAVLDAVGHAHRRGIIHRDLKPANVLVGELGETVVIDWGLAKVIGETLAESGTSTGTSTGIGSGSGSGSATVAGVVVGTPGFMPPEQVIGDAVDARSDVYALGATLYLLLAGRPPFTGDSATEILDRAVEGPPPPLPTLVPGAPPDLVSIVERAMAADREARFADAAVMGEELRRFLSGQLVASHHYSSRQRFARFVRRYRAVLAVAVLAAVAITAIGVFSLRRIVRDRDRIAAARSEAEAKATELRDFADGLIVDQARARLADDPTFAAATLLQLPADSTRWNDARAVLLDARTRGIAFALPGHGGRVLSLDIAPDGHRLISHGSDGVLRIHDLDARTSRIIGKSNAADIFRWSGDAIALRRPGGSLSILDPADGRERLQLDDDASTFDTLADGRIGWTTEEGAIRVADRDGNIVDVDRVARADQLELDLDDRILAEIGGEIALYRRDGTAWQRAWSEPGGLESTFQVRRDDQRFVVIRNRAIVEYAIGDDGLPRVFRTVPMPSVLFVTYAGLRLFACHRGLERIEWLDLGTEADTTTGRTVAVARNFTLSGPMPVVGSAVVYVGGNNPHDQITIAGPDHVLHLRGSERVLRTTGGHGRYIVGGTASHLLVWDTTEIVPDVIETSLAAIPSAMLAVSANHVAVTNEMFSAVIDTRTGTTLDLGPYVSQLGIAVSPDDGVVVRLVDKTRLQVIDLPTGALRYLEMVPDSFVLTRDRDRILLAEPRGIVVEVEIASNHRRDIADLGGPARGGDRAPKWSVLWSDRRVMRVGEATIDTLELASPPVAAAAASDGSVYIATTDTTIVRWPPNATATLPVIESTVAVRDLSAPGAPVRVMATSVDHALWQIDVPRATMAQLIPAVDGPPSLSHDGRCAVAARDRRGLVADLVRRTWWSLADLGVPVTGGTPAIDCSAIFVVAGGMLQRWQITLPDDPAALYRWLDARTNARVSSTHGVIEWLATEAPPSPPP
jgi:hypothetical protein